MSPSPSEATCSAAENPFRVERMHGVAYWSPGLDREALLARVAQPGVRGALVGPHGHGKTTLLLELGNELAARGHTSGYHCVGDVDRQEATIEARADMIYLIDGAERLPAWAWWRLRWRLRRARGVVITAHTAGRLPTLHTCETTTETVAYLLRALNPPQLDTLVARVPGLFARFDGDCRRILLALYDEFAGRED